MGSMTRCRGPSHVAAIRLLISSTSPPERSTAASAPRESARARPSLSREAAIKTSIMRQRGETWLLRHIQHAAGVYGFFTALARAARQQSEQEFCWWEIASL